MSKPLIGNQDIKSAFITEVLNENTFEICELGSCQYYISNRVIDFLLEWDVKYNELQSLFEDLGISVSFKKVIDLDEIKWNLIDVQEVRDARGNFDDMIWKCEQIVKICKAESIDDLFIVFKESSWDLWSAAPCIASKALDDLRIELPFETPTFGPIFNQNAQSQGIENGIQCFLLLKFKLIKDIECLKDFDT